MVMTEQRTPEQWQEAVDLTHACLAVNAGRLVEGFTVTVAQVAQCETTLAEGKALGYEPNPAVIERLMKRFMYTAGILGILQVATFVIMTKVATG